MTWKSYYLTVIAVFLMSSSCLVEKDTKIIVAVDISPPSFLLQGTGYLSRFAVYGPLAGEYSKEDDRPVAWKIFPDNESSSKPVSALPLIKYGMTPTGWQQHSPSAGFPEPLVEGAIYRAVANTNSASSGYIDFTIHQGKIILLNR